MKTLIIGFLIFSFGAEAQERPAQFVLRRDLLTEVQSHPYGATDTNWKEFGRFEEMLIAKGYMQVGESRLFVDRANVSDHECFDSTGEQGLGDSSKCEAQAFRFVKEMAHESGSVWFLIGEGNLVFNKGYRTLNSAQLNYQGIFRRDRIITPEPFKPIPR